MDKRQILILVGIGLIIIAIPITLYLVRQTQIFKPKAAFVPGVEFVDETGAPITETADPDVKVRITKEAAPSPTPAESPSPSPSTEPTPLPSPSASPEVSPSPSPSTVLLTNGGFENGLSGWECSGADSGTCESDSTTKFSGNSAAKVINTGGFWGWQLSQGNIQASPEEQFCLSARVKKGADSDRISIAIQETGGDYQGQRVIYASSGTEWQLVQSSVTVGSNWVLPIQVYLRAWNQGNLAWFDDVSLTRGACTSLI